MPPGSWPGIGFVDAGVADRRRLTEAVMALVPRDSLLNRDGARFIAREKPRPAPYALKGSMPIVLRQFRLPEGFAWPQIVPVPGGFLALGLGHRGNELRVFRGDWNGKTTPSQKVADPRRGTNFPALAAGGERARCAGAFCRRLGVVDTSRRPAKRPVQNRTRPGRGILRPGLICVCRDGDGSTHALGRSDGGISLTRYGDAGLL